MAVRIRLKKMGRTHRPFYRVCAMDRHTPRDGRVLEELGTYDTSVANTDARAILKQERVDYWLSVGAQPSDKVSVLIKKYGTDGTHLEQQRDALLKLAEPNVVPDPGAPASLPIKPEAEKPEAEKPEAKKPEAKKPEAEKSKEGGAGADSKSDAVESKEDVPSSTTGSTAEEAEQGTDEAQANGVDEKTDVVEADAQK